MTAESFLEKINSGDAKNIFSSIYGKDETALERYKKITLDFININTGEFPEVNGEVKIFSVPGRTELGGNHTDHNMGRVLAASIDLDAAAIAAPRKDMQVFFRSTGHKDVIVDLEDLSIREDEKGETAALIRGIAADFTAQGTPVKGFTAYCDSRVFTGSGLSSSAAIEVLFAKIFDSLYCGGNRSSLELAKAGQRAENIYFGKPSGLMDQAAAAMGGVICIDFKHKGNNAEASGDYPKIERVKFNLMEAGYTLCVINTGGSHADLLADYSAIPNEMKAIAGVFDKAFLREIDENLFMEKIPELRKTAGDRAVLRAMHFFNENDRVIKMKQALEEAGKTAGAETAGINKFLSLVNESGDSSWQLLQNIYSPSHPKAQEVSLALALTKNFLKGKEGACRVHGGGFAGTIQAYIKHENLEEYTKLMNKNFGNSAVKILSIRQAGAVELVL